MPAVVIRNLSVETHRALKQRAREKGVSTEAEIRSVLDDAVGAGGKGLGSVLYEMSRELGGVELDGLRDRSPLQPAEFE